MDIKNFIEELERIGIKLEQEQLDQLEKYYELLIEWNGKMNLTGITDKKEVYLKHFYDSLTIIKIIDINDKTLCDIGTGAGFPGLVLKIAFPKLHVTLIDSLNKRISFLKEVIKELGLKNVDVFHARAEEYAENNRNKFDIVTSRAVAPLSILMEYSVPILKMKGHFIPMKANIKDELKESSNAIKILKIELVEQQEFKLPVEESNRTLLKFEKLSSTSDKYPRKYSEIKKNPL